MARKSIYQQVLELNKASSDETKALNKSKETNEPLADLVAFEKVFETMTYDDLRTIFFRLDNATRNLIINKGNK